MLERLREAWHHWRHPSGLNTAAEVDEFVADIRREAPVADPRPEPTTTDVPIVPTRTELDLATPIYDALWRETMARLTAERVDAAFAEMVAAWRCDECRGVGADHRWCPGCSCPCSAVVDA